MRVAIWVCAIAAVEVIGFGIHFAQGLAENCGNGVWRLECSQAVGAVAAIVMLATPALAAWDLLLRRDPADR